MENFCIIIKWYLSYLLFIFRYFYFHRCNNYVFYAIILCTSAPVFLRVVEILGPGVFCGTVQVQFNINPEDFAILHRVRASEPLKQLELQLSGPRFMLPRCKTNSLRFFFFVLDFPRPPFQYHAMFFLVSLLFLPAEKRKLSLGIIKLTSLSCSIQKF